MAHLEGRPLKIRKLDSAFDDDQARKLARSTDAESLGWRKDDSATSIDNDPHGVVSPAVHEGETVPSNLNGDGNEYETEPAQPLSKNQLKKLQKKQRWEEGREYRKAKQKQKKKEKKARKAEERSTIDLKIPDGALPIPIPTKRVVPHPLQLPITFILDCGFDDLMTESEMISLASQLTRSYSENKRAPYQAHLVVTSFCGKLKHRFETVLSNNHLAWRGVKFTPEDFITAAMEADTVMRGPRGGQLVGALAVAKKVPSLPRQSQSSSKEELESSIMTLPCVPPFSETDAADGTLLSNKDSATNGTFSASMEQTNSSNSPSRTIESCETYRNTTKDTDPNIDCHGPKTSHEHSIVYLTSDSPHILESLSPYTTYIVGGLVDKNRHKGICYKRAMERNIPTAKLPIGEYMTMQSRSVLTTNHVVEIMVKWLESGDWAKAFLEVIPKRKEARLKVDKETGCHLLNKQDDPPSSGSPESGNVEGDGSDG